jgi:hypothetical protein
MPTLHTCLETGPLREKSIAFFFISSVHYSAHQQFHYDHSSLVGDIIDNEAHWWPVSLTNGRQYGSIIDSALHKGYRVPGEIKFYELY